MANKQKGLSPPPDLLFGVNTQQGVTLHCLLGDSEEQGLGGFFFFLSFSSFFLFFFLALRKAIKGLTPRFMKMEDDKGTMG